jgi:hypothetical protein
LIRRRTALALAAALAAGRLAAQCPANATSVAWPSGAPVWELCYRRPAATNYLLNGGGLEISDVRYRGIAVLKVANIPIVNVAYAPGGCGPCYRDFFYQERAFACAPEVSPGRCSGTSVPPATVCQHPGTDAGAFTGVAVEDLGDRLKLTSQAEAGWYRYVPVWEFFPDGTLQARFDATSIHNGCVAYTHDHHAYFRLDIDAGGSGGNVLDQVLPGGGTTRISTERSFTDAGAARSRWRISRPGSPSYVEVSRNAGDSAAGDALPFPGDFPVADGWALAYRPNETDDSAVATGCATGLNAFLTGESLDRTDLVLWVRAGALHQGEPGGITSDCSMVGPTIKVVAEQPAAPASLHTLEPCRVLDTRQPDGPWGGPALGASADRVFVLAGRCGVPATATAVSANLTVVGAAAPGHLSVWADGGPVPATSVLNFGSSQARANNAVIPLGAEGAFRVRVGAGPVDFILDVNGYFQ